MCHETRHSQFTRYQPSHKHAYNEPTATENNVNRHWDIIAECEIVEQGDKVEESDLDEVWRERYPSGPKMWSGDV